jgi:hypothetical protein
MRILNTLQQAFAFVAEAVLEIFRPDYDNYPMNQEQPIDRNK